MAIELSEHQWAAKLVKSGSDTFDVAAGKDIEVAHWAPGKVTDLSVTCPEGKAWSVRVIVEIEESDA